MADAKYSILFAYFYFLRE